MSQRPDDDVPIGPDDHESPAREHDEHHERQGRLAEAQAAARKRTQQATAWATELRRRSALIDAGFVVYERDRIAAGTVLGSAIAFRLFLFFVPCIVFGVGVMGALSGWVDAESITDTGRITGVLAQNVQSAQHQTTAAAVVSLLTGLVLMVSAGRSLAKSLVASSSLAWSATGKVTARVRAIASITGLMLSLVLVTIINNRIIDQYGVAFAGLSFGASFVLYVVIFVVLMASLPRGTGDPGALIPGAAFVAVVVTGMQAVSQIYIPNRLSSASELYGGIGVAVVALGWLFIIGRTLSLSMSMNAALFDRFGSLSQAIFSLPVLRVLPQRSTLIRNYFGLDDQGRSVPSAPGERPDIAAVTPAIDALREVDDQHRERESRGD